MRIPIYCENCGKLIGTRDSDYDQGVAMNWAEAACGEKICDECCEACERENTDGINFTGCPYKEESPK